MISKPRCRFCETPLDHTFCDLGMSPLSNAYLGADQLQSMEPFYPLHAYACGQCFLVQLEAFESPDHIFSDYAYFSSYSDSWLKHASDYTDKMIERFGFSAESQVVEIASNDGYLLQYFQQKGVPVLGVEPADNVAEVARDKGIDSISEFFGKQLAQSLVEKGKSADLLLGNNVLAHVPDINDFVAGMEILLKPEGVITMEFPHLLRLIDQNQFDTVYHEHFSYLSFSTVKTIFNQHGLDLFDVEDLETHGGSLRIYACHTNAQPVSNQVDELIKREVDAGLSDIKTYQEFARTTEIIKRDIFQFLSHLKEDGKTIVGYGAPAKGNTLLNYCGIGSDFIDYTVDRSPHKQGKYLPGTHIPVYPVEKILETKPDYVLILPWNLKDEVIEQMAAIREWGGKFITLIPQPVEIQ